MSDQVDDPKIVERPDGNLTIEGTNVFLPGTTAEIEREIDWTIRRLMQLYAAETYLHLKLAEQGKLSPRPTLEAVPAL